MAENLDVNPDVLRTIAGSFDATSGEVDELSLPGGVDGGIASGDILVLLADVSVDLAEIAGGLDVMSQQLLETRQRYISCDEGSAEVIGMVGDTE